MSAIKAQRVARVIVEFWADLLSNMGTLLLISTLLSLQYLGYSLSQECPQFRNDVQWMNGDKGIEGSSVPSSARQCQVWCQDYSKWDDYTYKNINPCIGWSFWAEPGPFSSWRWCYLFGGIGNESEHLLNTAHPSPGAVSGLKYDCESGRDATIKEMLLEAIVQLKLNKTTWSYINGDDLDSDQDGEISDNEVEHKFDNYMAELFKMMDQNKDNTITEQELQSLRFDLPGLNKVLEVAFENYPLRSLFLAADGNRDGVWDESDFFIPAKPFTGPLDSNESSGFSAQLASYQAKPGELQQVRNIERTQLASYPAKVKVYATPPPSGFSHQRNSTVKLTRRNGKNKGTVWINSEGVCQIGKKEGNVVCKSLGFEGLDSNLSESIFDTYEQANQRYICNGTETRLEDCQRTNCDQYRRRGHGVICKTKIGSLRLVGGKDSSSGDIFLGSEGLGCAPYRSDEWNLKQSEVICRELGFPGFVKNTRRSAFTKFVYPRPDVLQKEFQCRGDEKKLTDCPMVGIGNNRCYPYNLQGIICKTDAKNEMIENDFLEEISAFHRHSIDMHLWEENGRILFIADANNDGKLTFEEIKAKAKEYLATIFHFVDQTGDGYMSVKDFTSLHMAVGPIHQMMGRLFDAMAGTGGEIDLLQPIFLGRDLRQNMGSMEGFDFNKDSKLNAEDFYSYPRRIRDKSLYLIPLLSSKLDENQDGKIQRQELRQFTDAIFKELDIDGDGALTSVDFYSLMRENGHNNCLEVTEWRSFLTRFTHDMETQIKAMMSYIFNQLDVDGNSKIALKEFQQMHVPCALSLKEADINPGLMVCYRIFDNFFKGKVYFSVPRFPLSGRSRNEKEWANAACKMLT